MILWSQGDRRLSVLFVMWARGRVVDTCVCDVGGGEATVVFARDEVHL